MSKRVVILGGGVGGLSAAHELVERGFEVEVFERKDLPGGKARSLDVGTGRGGACPCPASTASASSPASTGTSSTPCGASRTGRAPSPTTWSTPPQLQIARFDRAGVSAAGALPPTPSELQSRRPRSSMAAGRRAGRATRPRRPSSARSLADPDLVRGAAAGRIRAHRLVGLHRGRRALAPPTSASSATASPARWWRPRRDRASTRPSATSSCRSCSTSCSPVTAADRVLNGPTNEVWIEPWLEHLRARASTYHLDAEVTGINLQQRPHPRAPPSISGARPSRCSGDYFVAALPVERMAELVTPDAGWRPIPALANLPELASTSSG